MNHSCEATVEWRAGEGGDAFTTRRYSRAHRWLFDGGAVVPGSSSPLVVPEFSDEAAVDPEEALIASLASCHMLFFLDLVSRNALDISAYVDTAVGEMGKRDDGKIAMLSVALRPRATFIGDADWSLVEELHHKAHELCYIANSLNFPVTVEPAK